MSNKKKVEVVQVIIKSPKDITPPTFEEILQNPDFHGKVIRYYAKHIQLSYVEDKGDYIVGVVETTQMGPTPPKHNIKTNEKKSLGLETPEGLLYGNVFLYAKATKVLMYEVTKSGTFIGQLDDFIYKLVKDSNLPKFSVRFPIVMNVDAMEKMLRMGQKKAIHMQFANPHGLIKKIKTEQKSLKEIVKPGIDVGAELIDVTYKISGRNDKSLHTKKVDQMLEYVAKEYNMLREHFNFIKVKGYDEDEEKTTEVDLIKDKMIQFISYSESKNMTDIRPNERKDQIILAYEKIEKDLNKYFLDDN